MDHGFGYDEERSVDWQLAALKTDYIDFGFLHCIDEGSRPAACHE